MHDQRTLAVALGLRRLRTYACLGLWAAGLALAAQTIVWSLAAFTDLRAVDAPPPDEAPLIVEGAAQKSLLVTPSRPSQPLAEAQEGTGGEAEADTADAEPETAAGHDRLLRMVHRTASVVGVLGLLLALPMLAVAAALLSAAGSPGMARVITAMAMTLTITTITLPIGSAVGLPWPGGLLSDYAAMIAAVEAAMAQDVGPGLMFYLWYCAFPAAAVVGLILAGFKFGSGVEAAILAGRDPGVDPRLEAEASNVRPTSLHGGRGMGDLARAVTGRSNEDDDVLHIKPGASPRTVSPGEAPRRII